MCCPKIVSIAKYEASHMISNGFVPLGAEMIGVEISSCFNLSHTFRHPSSKSKGTSFANRSVNGLAILLNSFMNHL